MRQMMIGFVMGAMVAGIGVGAYMMMGEPAAPPPPTPTAEVLEAVAQEAAVELPEWFEEFRQPETRPARNGVLDTSLTARFSELKIKFPPPDNDKTFYARIYDNMVPGPTLRASPGNKVRVLFINNLVDPRTSPPDDDANYQLTNLHTHGWHVSPSSEEENGKVVLAHDDVLLTILPPGWQPSSGDHGGHAIDPDDRAVIRERLQYEYDIPVYHAPGTHWYHAHRHGSVAKQTENGMAGALIIDEPRGQEIITGVQEKVIIIQDISNVLVEKTGTGQQMLTDVFNSPEAVRAALEARKRSELEPANLIYTTINGVYQPTLRMSPGEIQRWRVINAGSNTRAFNELFVRPAASNRGQNLNFFVVARDGVTLKEIEPVEVGTSLFMGPGNRVDLLVRAPVPDDAQPGRYLPALHYEVGTNKNGLLVGTTGYTNEKMSSLPDRPAPPILSGDTIPVGATPAIERTRPVYYSVSTEDGATTYQYKVPRQQGETVLGFVQVSGVPVSHHQLPTELPPPPPGADYLNDITDAEITGTRTVVFDVPFVKDGVEIAGDITGADKRLLVNGHEFEDEDALEIDVAAGAVEEWTVINNADQSHPFHIHVNPFQIVEIKQWMGYRDGDPSQPVVETPGWAPPEGTWLDTVTLPPRGYVKFRSRFPGTVTYQGHEYSFTGSYVLHCHILNHEDGGMMIQVNVNPGG